jgi:hypothetical protein
MTQKVDPKDINAIAVLGGELVTELLLEEIGNITAAPSNKAGKKEGKIALSFDPFAETLSVAAELSISAAKKRTVKKQRSVER